MPNICPHAVLLLEILVWVKYVKCASLLCKLALKDSLFLLPGKISLLNGSRSKNIHITLLCNPLESDLIYLVFFMTLLWLTNALFVRGVFFFSNGLTLVRLSALLGSSRLFLAAAACLWDRGKKRPVGRQRRPLRNIQDFVDGTWLIVQFKCGSLSLPGHMFNSMTKSTCTQDWCVRMWCRNSDQTVFSRLTEFKRCNVTCERCSVDRVWVALH